MSKNGGSSEYQTTTEILVYIFLIIIGFLLGLSTMTIQMPARYYMINREYYGIKLDVIGGPDHTVYVTNSAVEADSVLKELNKQLGHAKEVQK